MSMNGLPTPYDILHPAPPPLILPAIAWWAMIGCFILIWIITFRTITRRKRAKERPRDELSIVHELSSILDTFERTKRREEIHLFVNRAKREVPKGATGEAIQETLSQINALRFSPNITEKSTPLLRKTIDLFRSSGKEGI